MVEQQCIDNFVSGLNKLHKDLPKTSERLKQGDYLCGTIQYQDKIYAVIDFTKGNNYDDYQQQGSQLINSFQTLYQYMS